MLQLFQIYHVYSYDHELVIIVSIIILSLWKVLLDYSYLIINSNLASDYKYNFHDYYPCHQVIVGYCLILLSL